MDHRHLHGPCRPILIWMHSLISKRLSECDILKQANPDIWKEFLATPRPDNFRGFASMPRKNGLYHVIIYFNKYSLLENHKLISNNFSCKMFFYFSDFLKRISAVRVWIIFNMTRFGAISRNCYELTQPNSDLINIRLHLSSYNTQYNYFYIIFQKRIMLTYQNLHVSVRKWYRNSFLVQLGDIQYRDFFILRHVSDSYQICILEPTFAAIL